MSIGQQDERKNSGQAAGMNVLWTGRSHIPLGSLATPISSQHTHLPMRRAVRRLRFKEN